MKHRSTATRIHRGSSKHNPRRIFDVLAESLRLTILTVSIIFGIYGIYSNQNDNNVTEVVRLVLQQAPQVIRSVKRLRR
jgi:hypothetical protein